VRHTTTSIELVDPGLRVIELPAFCLDEGGDGFGGKERFGPPSTFRERLEAFLGVRIDSNGEGCGHLCALCNDVYILTRSHGAHQRPFALHLFESAKQELPESTRLLNLANGWFDDPFACRVDRCAGLRVQLPGHAVDDRRRLRQRAARARHRALAVFLLPRPRRTRRCWLDADAAERERLRVQLAADRPDLVGEADALVRLGDRLPGFLETPALLLAARNVTPDDSLLPAGSLLGPYRIVSLLARGGMGDVYRATDVRLHRDVALKVLAKTKTGDPSRVERFAREARVTAAPDHPNVVRIFDVGRLDDREYLVAELLEGETLRARLARGPMAVEEVVRIATDVVRGLGAAHDAGLVHRDLKPENIFLTHTGTAKILDFGIAKLAQDETVRDGLSTLAGVVFGTAGYLAPEQIRGEPVDVTADLFGVGAVLFEMLTGRRAFARAHRDVHRTGHRCCSRRRLRAGYGDGDRGHGSIRGRDGKLHRRTDIHVRDGRGHRGLRGDDYAGECEPAVRSANGGSLIAPRSVFAQALAETQGVDDVDPGRGELGGAAQGRDPSVARMIVPGGWGHMLPLRSGYSPAEVVRKTSCVE
jgi:hypothetical protein